MKHVIPDAGGEVFIAGRWHPAEGEGDAVVFDSTTESELARVRSASPGQVDEAVRAARSALPGWKAAALEERLSSLAAVAKALAEEQDLLTDLLVREVGQVRKVAADVQVSEPIAGLTSVAEHVNAVHWMERINDSYVRREPVGVVAAITPWNYPLTTLVAKVAPALAAGCVVVAKPTEIAPLDALRFAEATRRAGLPDGVFNLVTGTGPGTGSALVAHPGADMVTLTGSTRAGREVSALAAQTVKRVHLELGGKSACVVLPDADLAAALRDALDSCFLNAGQICTAQTRILVPQERLSEAEEIVAELVRATIVGDPFDAGVDLGPVASEQHRVRIDDYIRLGIEEGARVVAGGAGMPTGLDRGYYVRPTVFSDADNDMRITREEIFGPVGVLLPYRTEDHAVTIANDTPYGLSGAVWSSDEEHAESVAGRIDAGQILINGARSPGITPFGGVKQSGYGSEGGRFGVEQFLVYKTLHHRAAT
jgi:aldehyde dehydrogenase (NAD+)